MHPTLYARTLRIASVVLLAAAACLPAAPAFAAQRSQSFDTDPGWAGANFLDDIEYTGSAR